MNRQRPSVPSVGPLCLNQPYGLPQEASTMPGLGILIALFIHAIVAVITIAAHVAMWIVQLAFWLLARLIGLAMRLVGYLLQFGLWLTGKAIIGSYDLVLALREA